MISPPAAGFASRRPRYHNHRYPRKLTCQSDVTPPPQAPRRPTPATPRLKTPLQCPYPKAASPEVHRDGQDLLRRSVLTLIRRARRGVVDGAEIAGNVPGPGRSSCLLQTHPPPSPPYLPTCRRLSHTPSSSSLPRAKPGQPSPSTSTCRYSPGGQKPALLEKATRLPGSSQVVGHGEVGQGKVGVRSVVKLEPVPAGPPWPPPR